MSKPTNFRREVKNLWKNYQRGEVTEEGIQNWFEERGIIAGKNSIQLLLETDIPSKIFSRIGRAAKKKGKFVPFQQFFDIWRKKRSPVGLFFLKCPESYHLITFLNKEVREEIIVKKYISFTDEKGKTIEKYITTYEPYCISLN